MAKFSKIWQVTRPSTVIYVAHIPYRRVTPRSPIPYSYITIYLGFT